MVELLNGHISFTSFTNIQQEINNPSQDRFILACFEFLQIIGWGRLKYCMGEVSVTNSNQAQLLQDIYLPCKL